MTINDSKVIVLAGTAGTGKSSVGEALLIAHSSSYPKMEFLEGDLLHPKTNVDKMAHGIPLNDDDRWDWLKQVSKLASKSSTKNGGLSIISCSSLKRKYRDLIRDTSPDTSFYFIFLYGDKNEILKRLENRKGHFMKADMLESQFKDLELPNQDEKNCAIVNIDNKDREQVVSDVKNSIGNFLSKK